MGGVDQAVGAVGISLAQVAGGVEGRGEVDVKVLPKKSDRSGMSRCGGSGEMNETTMMVMHAKWRQ